MIKKILVTVLLALYKGQNKSPPPLNEKSKNMAKGGIRCYWPPNPVVHRLACSSAIPRLPSAQVIFLVMNATPMMHPFHQIK